MQKDKARPITYNTIKKNSKLASFFMPDDETEKPVPAV